MTSESCFLIALLHNGTLLWCAIKLESGAVSEDVIDNYMEPENRDILHALLPWHLRECGPIVSVEPLLDVFIAQASLKQEGDK